MLPTACADYFKCDDWMSIARPEQACTDTSHSYTIYQRPAKDKKTRNRYTILSVRD